MWDDVGNADRLPVRLGLDEYADRRRSRSKRHYQEPDNDHLYEGAQGAAAQTFTYWDEMSPEIRATLLH
ncbi:MAG: hypothetical protein R3F11_19000 [Verrucomicrobiales bacterium]